MCDSDDSSGEEFQMEDDNTDDDNYENDNADEGKIARNSTKSECF